jgi:peptidyl-dipeptidase A
MIKEEHPFEEFLKSFIPVVARKSRQLNKALWILETTGSSDAADLKADLDTELRMLFHDRAAYEKLLKWDADPLLKEPLLKRQLNVLIRAFKQNLIPEVLLEEIAQREAKLTQLYANFRPEIEPGVLVSENQIREILKKEDDPLLRKKAWEASKQIGDALASAILTLVALRNEAAKSLGYSNYFEMQLDLQEVDTKWLNAMFEDLASRCDQAYSKIIEEIEENQVKRFNVRKEDLGPWSWSDPFCQEDPLDTAELDSLVGETDISQASVGFYGRLGVEVKSILERSDLFERPGKNQHAFCLHIDREGDVRTLNNIQPSLKWMETVLHELGHAIYELGLNEKLPWLLREPPHMISTEAMALIAGRQAYRSQTLAHMIGDVHKNELLLKKAEVSLRRRQHIFSRWVLVMTAFERELYRDPSQDLNVLWWSLVEKYQKIRKPQGREKKSDWAAKYHIGLAPVYYFSYLLGEMFASAIEEVLSTEFVSERTGDFLKEKLFYPGNSMTWTELVKHVTGKPLSSDAWIRQFAT